MVRSKQHTETEHETHPHAPHTALLLAPLASLHAGDALVEAKQVMADEDAEHKAILVENVSIPGSGVGSGLGS